MPPKTASTVRRSRTGCNECRRRRRRCDEKKPACGYCVSVKHECSYAMVLSWGGRPFKKSTFGKCLGQDVGVIAATHNPSEAATRKNLGRSANSFVYGTHQRNSPTSSETCTPLSPPSEAETPLPLDHVTPDSVIFESETCSDLVPIVQLPNASRDHSQTDRSIDEVAEENDTDITVTIQHQPSEFSWIPAAYRPLLDHFLVGFTGALSCHKGVQHDLCTTFLPMALQSSHLLAAILCISATHRSTIGLAQSHVEIEHFRTSSLKQLRFSLSSEESNLAETSMATTLMLCLSEIFSDKENTESWRIHLQGAAALWREATQDQTTPTWTVLRRLYISIQSIALSCGMLDTSPPLALPDAYDEDYIDDFWGFSTALLPIFDETNRMINEYQNSRYFPELLGDEEESTQEKCKALIDKVQRLIARRVPKFSPRMQQVLSPQARYDYFLLDEALHHMALLQLFSRSKTSHKDDVQTSVTRIIACVTQMSFIDEACPSVAILPPVFVAGCHAHTSADRQAIAALLHKSEIFFGLGNVKLARRTLEQLWKANYPRCYQREGPCLEWLDIISAKSKGLLPY